MKKYTIIICTCLSTLILSASAPKKQNTQPQKSQTKVVKNITTTTVVKPAPQSTNEGLNFDSIIKNMNSLVLPENIHGYWKYDKTMEFRKGQLSEYSRSYFSFDKEGNINSTQENVPTDLDPIKMRQAEQEQAMKMGRTQIAQEDLIIVYDPNVSYFFWNQGNGKQLFVTQKINGKNVTYLTTADTRYSMTKNEKTGKYTLDLSCPDTGRKKTFLVLSITDDQMVLADLEYKELQFFNKTTR